MNIRVAFLSLGVSPLLALAGFVTTPVVAQEQVGVEEQVVVQEPLGLDQPSVIPESLPDGTAAQAEVSLEGPEADQVINGSDPLSNVAEPADVAASLDAEVKQQIKDEKIPTTIEVLEQAASTRAADLNSPSRVRVEYDPSVAELFSDIEEDTFGQVTDVNQLSDVSPTDWAFQALQALIQRWGCIAGYPDGTFRGQQGATRFELAAALNACLDSAADKFATKEELEVVKKLQEEFAAELAVLKGRVDQLEARTDLLEEQQFSTTTKLSVSLAMAGQFGDSDGAFDPSSDGPGGAVLGRSNATAISAVYMSFNTSFTENDLLETTLFFGNGGERLFHGRCYWWYTFFALCRQHPTL